MRLSPNQIHRIFDLRERSWGIEAIAEVVGCNPSTVQYHLIKNGIEHPKPWTKKPNKGGDYYRNGKLVRRFTSREDAVILKMSSEGKTSWDIARFLKRPQNSVAQRLHMLARWQERKENEHTI